MSEKRMQEALVRHFNTARLAVPNADFNYEIDLAVVSKANYLYDVEIKCSVSDWNADVKKKKWADGLMPFDSGEKFGHTKHWERLYKFYYAIVDGMQESIPTWVEDWMGIIVVTPSETRYWKAKEHKPAKRLQGRRKLTEEEVADLGRKLHFRYWATRGAWPGVKDLTDGSTYAQKPEFLVSSPNDFVTNL